MAARHILICFHDFARGGTERIALTLAREWIEAGREVTILCGSRKGGVIDQADPRIRIVELDPPLDRSPLSRLRLGPAMAARLGEIGPDVVFIPGNFHFILAHAFKRAVPGLPVVAKVSNPLLPALPAPLSWIARRALRAYVRPIDALVHMAPELAESAAQTLPGKRGATVSEPNLGPGHVALPRSGPLDPPLILAIGRMEPQKNLALALRAFAELLQRRPARLLVLGEGGQRPALERLARQLRISHAVEMPGYSPDTARHLASASALLLTSRYEGYPAVVVEALAADVPVVATACTPALRGLITSEVHGRIVGEFAAGKLADALEQVLQMPFESAGIRPAAVAHHDARVSAGEYLALFDRLVP